MRSTKTIRHELSVEKCRPPAKPSRTLANRSEFNLINSARTKKFERLFVRINKIVLFFKTDTFQLQRCYIHCLQQCSAKSTK